MQGVTRDQIIAVRNISKSFGNKTVLKNLSFEIFENEILVLGGKNGVGKTTLIKLLLNLLSPDDGAIYFSQNEKSVNINDLKNALYYEFTGVLETVQNTYFYLSGAENIDYMLALQFSKLNFRSEKVQKLIDLFNLREYIDQPVSKYSRGMVQKLSLIIALSGNQKVLFLDEPTLGLDIISKNALIEQIKSLATNKTIILTTHSTSEIEKLAQRIIILNHAKIIYNGNLDTLQKKTHQNLENSLLTAFNSEVAL
jgi:ABC-2 type transport system ATP-binding protein